jgi:hypothetical protein
MELDTGKELNATECAEVVGGMDLSSDHGRRMERGRRGRRASGW